jgi:PadR family transcriptional regulator, regulatory protein PadR
MGALGVSNVVRLPLAHPQLELAARTGGPPSRVMLVAHQTHATAASVGYLHMWEDLIKGHLDGLILGVLEGQPLHGYAVMEAIRSGSQGSLDLPSGTIYPALRRLELAGCIAGEWSLVNGRRRRTYHLTARGWRELEEKRGAWRAFSVTVGSLLGVSS